MRVASVLLSLALAACSAGPPPVRPIATSANTFATPEAAAAQAQKNPSTALGEPALKLAPIDKTRELQMVEFTVDQSDPKSMRQLAPYILKPDVWVLVKREPLSTTSYRFKFQRLISAEGKAIPEIDPLNPPKRDR